MMEPDQDVAPDSEHCDLCGYVGRFRVIWDTATEAELECPAADGGCGSAKWIPVEDV